MADRDLYELIEGAEVGGFSQSMRWRPCPEDFEPAPYPPPAPMSAQVYEQPGRLTALWDYLKSGTAWMFR